MPYLEESLAVSRHGCRSARGWEWQTREGNQLGYGRGYEGGIRGFRREFRVFSYRERFGLL